MPNNKCSCWSNNFLWNRCDWRRVWVEDKNSWKLFLKKSIQFFPLNKIKYIFLSKPKILIFISTYVESFLGKYEYFLNILGKIRKEKKNIWGITLESKIYIYISPILVLIKFPVLSNETLFWSIPLPRLVMFQMTFNSKTAVYDRIFFFFFFVVVMFFILYFGT